VRGFCLLPSCEEFSASRGGGSGFTGVCKAASEWKVVCYLSTSACTHSRRSPDFPVLRANGSRTDCPRSPIHRGTNKQFESTLVVLAVQRTFAGRQPGRRCRTLTTTRRLHRQLYIEGGSGQFVCDDHAALVDIRATSGSFASSRATSS